jgi:hypothetical protein
MRIFNKDKLKPVIYNVVYTWQDKQGYVYKAVRNHGLTYELFLTESKSHVISEMDKHCTYSQGLFIAPTIGYLIEYFKQLEKTGP